MTQRINEMTEEYKDLLSLSIVSAATFGHLGGEEMEKALYAYLAKLEANEDFENDAEGIFNRRNEVVSCIVKDVITLFIPEIIFNLMADLLVVNQKYLRIEDGHIYAERIPVDPAADVPSSEKSSAD